MKLNNPLPQPLPKECEKASKIFKSFVDSGNNGLDGVIPRNVLENARGFAIFTIFKAGFLFSARAGGGIVIARLEDGSWSAPSAIGLAGVGVGGQVGAEMTDFLIVLNSRSAVRSFMAAGSLTLGGNMSLAVGPLGRNGEASGALNTSGKVAAMYSYSKTRGLFGGVSVEGSVIVERQDANAQAYRADVSAKQLLSGGVTNPDWTLPLIRTIEACTSMPGGRQWVADSAPGTPRGGALDTSYAFGGISSPNTELPPSIRKQQAPRKSSKASAFPPGSWGTRKAAGSYFESPAEEAMTGSTGSGSWDYDRPTRVDPPMANTTPDFATRFESDFVPETRPTSTLRYSSQRNSSLDIPRSTARPLSTHNRSFSAAVPPPTQTTRSPGYDDGYNVHDPFAPTLEDDPYDPFTPRNGARTEAAERELKKPLARGEGVARAIALFDFKAVQSGDLSFLKGQVITVTEKSNTTDTWWKGKLEGREGSFPANFVEVV